MAESQGTGGLIRVERGSPDDAELAALTAVLLATAAAAEGAPEEDSDADRAVAPWRRPERSAGFFAGPRTWQRTAG